MSVNCKHWRDANEPRVGHCDHPGQPHGPKPSHGTCESCALREAVGGSYRRAAGRAFHGAKSTAKTAIGIDRLPAGEVKRRLDVCRQCDEAQWADGDVHTCGPMLESMKREGRGACGCILSKKARDAKESCPHGYWPEPRKDDT